MTAEPREVPEVQEGDNCLDEQCTGKYEWKQPDGCYCHISPPCHVCVENQPVCDECGLTAEEAEDMN